MCGANRTVFQSKDEPNREVSDLNAFLAEFDVASKLFDCGEFRLSETSKCNAMQHYIGIQYFGKLNKSKYSSISDNLHLVYGDTHVTKKDILSFHLVESKIIHDYLGIQNLDKLFDEDFFDFEWDIHTQQDFDRHCHGYQRDHFIHQIRNLWMMDAFLDNYGFYEASKCVLKNGKNSPVSRYVSTKCKQTLENEQSSFFRLLEKMKEFQTGKGNYADRKADYQEEFFYSYVIHAAAYLSALFHDLGYPVVHFLKTRRRLSEYSPASYMFTQNFMESFDMIANKLCDSLLFTIESAENVRKNMQPDENGKFDHGVYSAIPFLLHFYESGLIYRLAPEKTCAIELAAVAIYNHNLSLFACTEKPEDAAKREYYQPYFNQNPIAFLLQTCDDLQEWDRRYFEITGKTDIMFCPKCHRPMMKIPYAVEGIHRSGIDEPLPKRFQYICRCEKSNQMDDSESTGDFAWMSIWPTRQEEFLRRKIYLIRACDSVVAESFYANKQGEGRSEINGRPNILRVSVQYDLFRLLMLSRYSFAQFRIKDLRKLKKRLAGQDYRFQCEQADPSHNYADLRAVPEAIYIDYFLSSNPITIKVKMIERWLELSHAAWQQELSLNQAIYGNDNWNIESPQMVNFLESIQQYMCISDLTLCADFHISFWFYIKLLTEAKDVQLKKKTIECAVKAMEPMIDRLIKDSMLRVYTKSLVHDCFEQYKGEFTTTDSYTNMRKNLYADPQKYEKCCTSSSDLFDTISRYCYGDAPFNASSSKEEINYYNDLFLFYVINEKIKARNQASN